MADKRETKLSRLNTYIANMEDNEESAMTPLAQKLKMHPNTLRNMLDERQNVQEAGKIEIIRDKSSKKKKIKSIRKVRDQDRDLFFKKEIRGVLVNLSNKVDEISEDILEIKNKLASEGKGKSKKIK